jgi:hypothetical protein
MYSHTTAAKIHHDLELSNNTSWIKQQAKVVSLSGKTKEDVVLITNIPGSKPFVSILFQSTSGTSAMSTPKSLADMLASKFLSEVEEISIEVRKTQLSLMKIGGENYMKTISDKALGMKVSVSEVQSQYGPVDIPGRQIVKIEWHTKSSIAQGRPPQVQKVCL